ncbi:unnamed protein product [Paramecium primaurelia]|uniref:Uncharacterized protein n=2 Tax=Paramecium TaxID=5884 RepID=A0A8S1WX78_9CILI|nr:unnamed protein product [Paramecium primaurelia]CAD8194453.1 unnamed protein product [Paramecium pentaurelia]
MNRTPSFRQAANKENLFIQIANKKSLSNGQKVIKSETSKYADEHYEDLIKKIYQLDQENNKLRELLKKSNYLQFKFVDLSKSDYYLHSFTDIKNRSLDLSLDELKGINNGRSNEMLSQKKSSTPRQSLTAKQIQIQKQRNNLINSYTQDLIQEQTTFDYLIPDEVQEQENCFQEFYKTLLINVVNKDMKIFKHIDQVVEQELKQNFQTNCQNYDKQKNLLSNLIQLLSNMQNYCSGEHPDNQFIMRAYKSIQEIIGSMFRMFEKMKLHILPLNHIQLNFQERIQEIDKLQEQTEYAQQQLKKASIVIEHLSKENHQLKIQNKEYQDFFTQISYKLQINDDTSQLKQSLDSLMNKCIEGIIKLQNFEFQKSQKIEKISPVQNDQTDLQQKLKIIQDKYDKLKQKNNKNKEKFKFCLNKIYDCFEQNVKQDYFQQLTIEEQVQLLCQTIYQIKTQ